MTLEELIAHRAGLRTMMLDLIDRLQPADPRFGHTGPLLSLDGILPLRVIFSVIPQTQDSHVLLQYVHHTFSARENAYRPQASGSAPYLIRGLRMPTEHAQALMHQPVDALCAEIKNMSLQACNIEDHRFVDTLLRLAVKRLWEEDISPGDSISFTAQGLKINTIRVPLFTRPENQNFRGALPSVERRMRSILAPQVAKEDFQLAPFDLVYLRPNIVQRPSAHAMLETIAQIRAGLEDAGIDSRFA